MNELLLNCPTCKQSDKIQKVSAIYKGETHQWTETHNSTNADGTSSTSYIPRQAQTVLAKQLTPPEKPSAGGNSFLLWSGIGGFVLFILLIGFALPIGVTLLALLASLAVPVGAYFIFDGRELGLTSPIVLGGLVGLLCLSTLILLALLWLLWRWWKGKYDASVEQHKMRQAQAERDRPYWEWAMARWENLYYCNRDDIIFIPGENRAVPTPYMTDYLYNRY